MRRELYASGGGGKDPVQNKLTKKGEGNEEDVLPVNTTTQLQPRTVRLHLRFGYYWYTFAVYKLPPCYANEKSATPVCT